MVPGVLPVKVTEQVPDTRVQLVLVGETPAPLAEKPTLPLGALPVPGEVSVTVAVQVLAWPTTTGVSQLTAVAVVRVLTVMEALAELVSWMPSPP